MSTFAIILIILLVLIIIGAIIGLVVYFIRRNRHQNNPLPPITPINNCILPTGAWQQTCTNPSLNGSILTAQCRDSSGTPKSTTLDLSKCSTGPVTNNGGVLTCTPGTGLCPA
ncbi:hypothetical protein H012_gp370 [Acanthamoeba polyphaga moumouvirus]|uniref:Cyanovirin-N domain-containing protein n=1 Tax=Acanthamoeba polyphaga moumouvirus TaxID=1269028 RepID=L7RCS6_9VIRU|nr:hypothetical protein H012_gp370 [Acanthamoeba polyphaga moumouvirus]AGC02087.1 hypothetical protein Moumou_00557 [Acanthamoeba polyphaga moumouvirus]AQN68458.1 hypothetical protein [Saudi moumouvirus]